MMIRKLDQKNYLKKLKNEGVRRNNQYKPPLAPLPLPPVQPSYNQQPFGINANAINLHE